jgi:hypothetical protein
MMPSQISYSEIYSQFFLKIEGYDLFDGNLSDEYRDALLTSWLRTSIGKPYVNRLFSTVTLTDPHQEEDSETEELIDVDGIIEYELKNKIDEDFGDKQFITEVLAYGMVLCWLEPKVNSLTNIAQLIGTSDEKLRELKSHSSLYLETLQCIPSYMLENPYSLNAKTER